MSEHYAIVFDFMWLIFKYFNVTKEDIKMIVEDMLHNFESKRFSIGVSVALAGHILYALIQTCVTEADGGVAAEEQLINLFSLFQTSQCAILPMDRAHIARSSKQPFMSSLQSAMAKIKTLIKDSPEFIEVLFRTTGHIYKIDGNHTLIKAAIIFLTLYPISCISNIFSSTVRS